jgi:hypothetical protein
MKKYRIVSNGIGYRVQERSLLWPFWMNADFMVFGSMSEAEDHVQFCKDQRAPWRPIA